MHILHINDSIAQDIAGGSRQYAHEIARCMVERGHRVSFLVPKARPELPSEEVREGARIVRFEGANALDKYRALQRTFLTLHETSPVDVVFVHFGYTALGYHRLPIARQIPTVRVFHGPWDRESEAERGERGLKNRLMSRVMFTIDRYSLRCSDQVITLSEFMAEDVRRRFGIPEARVGVIPGGVDTRRFLPGDRREARQKLGLSEDAFLVFTARRLVRRMGLDVLIEAAAQARSKIPNLQVCIAGKGPQAEELQQSIQRQGVGDQVRMLGFVPDAQLRDYYCAADVFVLPSLAMEGFGLIILEALACNTPVLGTPVGAIPEVLRCFDPQMLLAGVSPSDIAEGLIQAHQGRFASATDYREKVVCGYDWGVITDRLLARISSQDSTAKRRVPAISGQSGG